MREKKENSLSKRVKKVRGGFARDGESESSEGGHSILLFMFTEAVVPVNVCVCLPASSHPHASTRVHCVGFELRACSR